MRQSVSITEREAVKLKVVDLVADSVPDLLEKVDGRTVKTAKGPVTLATKGAQAQGRSRSASATGSSTSSPIPTSPTC